MITLPSICLAFLFCTDIEQVLSALEAVHCRQIIHRDIKPENIMLQSVPGDDHVVRVLDFGLVKLIGQNSQTSMAAGTPEYMAPEQIRCGRLSPATDLYAVGAVLFELLTGRNPHFGCPHQEIIAEKLDPKYDFSKRVADLHLPEPVSTFFRRSMARDVDERYQSVEQFRAALRKVFELMNEGLKTTMSPEGMAAVTDTSQLLKVQREKARLEEEKKRLEEQMLQLEREKQLAERRLEEQEVAAASDTSTSAVDQPSADQTEQQIAHMTTPLPGALPSAQAVLKETPARQGSESQTVVSGPIPTDTGVAEAQPKEGFHFQRWHILAIAAVCSVFVGWVIFWAAGETDQGRIETAGVRPVSIGTESMVAADIGSGKEDATQPYVLGTLEKAVTITSTPPGAEVSVDGRHIGKTQIKFTFRRREEPYEIKVRNEGFQPYSRKVVFDDLPATLKIELDLEF